jgi:hypothetical protein
LTKAVKAMTRQTREQIELGLSQVIGGTEEYLEYKPLGGATVYLTDGVRYLADAAGCWWLVEEISFAQKQVRKDPVLDEFQIWILKVDLEKKSAELQCLRDTNDVAYSKVIVFTDFPLPEIKLYVGPEGVICLPSEN